jgi:hypothetical protein
MAPDCEMTARSPFPGIRGAKLALKVRRRHQHPEAIGADQPQAGGARGPVRRFCQRPRTVTETGGYDDGGRRTLGSNRRHRLGHRGRRHRNHYDIGRSGDGVDGFDGADPFDVAIVRIDHVNRPGKAGGDEVCDHVPADRRFPRARTDDGQRVRHDQPVQAICRHWLILGVDDEPPRTTDPDRVLKPTWRHRTRGAARS